MCILSFYRPGVMPDAERLAQGARSNRDGNGFAVIVGDRIDVHKSMNATALIDAFVKVRRAHPESYALFHSRITTDGVTNVENCHPFAVGNARTVLAHNGILPEPARPGDKDLRSDTRILAEDLIPSGLFGHLTNRRARRRLTRWMSGGYPNKIAILTVDPRYGRNAYLLNEHLGVWDEGVWYSNDSYIPWRERYGFTSRSLSYMSWDSTDDALWAQYRRGDITYNEYLAQTSDAYDRAVGPVGSETLRPMALTGTATGWPETSGRSNYGKCSLCGAPDSVNLVVGYCTNCLHCVDCELRTVDCQCMVPDSDRTTWARDVSTQQQDDAIESAIREIVARSGGTLPQGER